MKLFAKMFFFGTAAFSLAFLLCGYFLMRYSLETNLEREREVAVRQYQYDKFTFQSGLIARGWYMDNEDRQTVLQSIAADVDAPVALLDREGGVLLAETEAYRDMAADSLSEDACAYRMEDGCILTGGILEWRGEPLRFITCQDISPVLAQHETLVSYFRSCYFILLAVTMLLTALVAVYFARAGRLSRAAREKEDFAANFAHELKTPLTSVIGYAELLYRKELPPDERKQAAWYIWNEGMRLEALSHKLMELTASGHEDMALMWVPAEGLLQDGTETLEPVLEKKGIRLELRAEDAYVQADGDLFKTLLSNLIDNSVKAGSSRIEVTGRREKKRYRVTVADDGCGMPGQELPRITEAFYMIDKSRSRKHHGAGLGLALAEKIAQLHGGSLEFESREGEGTKVSLCLACREGGDEDA